jgi:hypothetical protein
MTESIRVCIDVRMRLGIIETGNRIQISKSMQSGYGGGTSRVDGGFGTEDFTTNLSYTPIPNLPSTLEVPTPFQFPVL